MSWGRGRVAPADRPYSTPMIERVPTTTQIIKPKCRVCKQEKDTVARFKLYEDGDPLFSSGLYVVDKHIEICRSCLSNGMGAIDEGWTIP